MESATHPPFEVAIVGGGPAGLAAALVLGRVRPRVLLLDADDPAHGVSDGVHGLFGHDGTPPSELRRTAREQLRPYESVITRTVTVEEACPTPSGFSVMASGTTSEAGVLLLATGMRYELPRIEGVAQIWARGAYHCPYCHGWEVRTTGGSRRSRPPAPRTRWVVRRPQIGQLTDPNRQSYGRCAVSRTEGTRP
jgi:thioredoxin reductase